MTCHDVVNLIQRGMPTQHTGVPVLKQIFGGNSVPPAKWQTQYTRRAYTYHNLIRKSQRIPFIGESPFSWHSETHTKI